MIPPGWEYLDEKDSNKVAYVALLGWVLLIGVLLVVKDVEHKKEGEGGDRVIVPEDLPVHTVDVGSDLHFCSLPIMGILSVIHIVFVLVMISMYTVGERKAMASVQRRFGPNVNGLHGLLQPFADGLKLVLKEIILPYKADKILFLLAPIVFLTFSLTLWGLLPLGSNIVLVDSKYSLLLVFMISSFTVYGIIFSGWASNSTYAFLGALRSAAQMISYEVILGFIIITIALTTGCFSFLDLLNYQEWLSFALLPISLIFFVAALAETNRAPFDLPESESELVAGYNVEYSSIVFAMFFLGEYSNLLIMGFTFVIFFFSGASPSTLFMFSTVENNGLLSSYLLIGCTLPVLLLFVLVRSVLPRYRYDQLMQLGWTIFLPVLLGFLFFVLGLLFYSDAFPDVMEVPYIGSTLLHCQEIVSTEQYRGIDFCFFCFAGVTTSSFCKTKGPTIRKLQQIVSLIKKRFGTLFKTKICP